MKIIISISPTLKLQLINFIVSAWILTPQLPAFSFWVKREVSIFFQEGGECRGDLKMDSLQQLLQRAIQKHSRGEQAGFASTTGGPCLAHKRPSFLGAPFSPIPGSIPRSLALTLIRAPLQCGLLTLGDKRNLIYKCFPLPNEPSRWHCIRLIIRWKKKLNKE